MRVRQAALASEPVAEEAAHAHLSGGGGALSAVLSGFFAAAGATAGVLLGPISILVGGIGQGARAFDGRVRQPGLGARRPRGFVEGAEIPNAALVAVPTAPLAAIVALAYGGGASLASVVRPGVESATRAGAPRRAEWLSRLGQVGAAALTEPFYRRALLHVGSTSEGGVLTPSDLELQSDVDLPALESADEGWLLAPWAADAARVKTARVPGRGAGICAADVHGVVAALCYRSFDAGAWVEELELMAPLAAVPVRRGVPRVAPGTRLSVPAPLALKVNGTDPVEVSVEPENALITPDSVRSPRLSLRRDPLSMLVASMRQ